MKNKNDVRKYKGLKKTMERNVYCGASILPEKRFIKNILICLKSSIRLSRAVLKNQKQENNHVII